MGKVATGKGFIPVGEVAMGKGFIASAEADPGEMAAKSERKAERERSPAIVRGRCSEG